MKYAKWWVPILLMAILTPFTPMLDLATTRYFYHDGHFVSNDATNFFYVYGFWPADMTGVAAAVALLLSYCSIKWKKWRSPALVLLLTLILGSGFITHTLLKDQWGRPRPKQVEEFGGTQAFRPYYEPNFLHQPQPSKSFPCGHCTTGFYFFALALVGRRLHSPSTYVLSMIFAVALGVALSVVRIAQGGHFLSDTLISALIMWFTALACDWLVYGADDLQ